jgi:hypothetical protein
MQRRSLVSGSSHLVQKGGGVKHVMTWAGIERNALLRTDREFYFFTNPQPTFCKKKRKKEKGK